MPVRPPPIIHVIRMTRSVGMPVTRARFLLSAIARIAFPSFVRWSRMWTPSISPAEARTSVSSWFVKVTPASVVLPGLAVTPFVPVFQTKAMMYRSASATPMEAMSSEMPLLNNPMRRGALLVLLSPDVPAVLVELAFLSNSADEANLTSEAWRRRAVGSLADGIDGYFEATAPSQRLGHGQNGGHRRVRRTRGVHAAAIDLDAHLGGLLAVGGRRPVHAHRGILGGRGSREASRHGEKERHTQDCEI